VWQLQQSDAGLLNDQSITAIRTRIQDDDWAMPRGLQHVGFRRGEEESSETGLGADCLKQTGEQGTCFAAPTAFSLGRRSMVLDRSNGAFRRWRVHLISQVDERTGQVRILAFESGKVRLFKEGSRDDATAGLKQFDSSSRGSTGMKSNGCRVR
jgi:hypothetical protein